MITITPCTSSDCNTITTLWDAMATVPESCWYQAASPSPEVIEQLMVAGVHFVLATDGEQAVGFGSWRPIGQRLSFHALAAGTAEVYYHLMVAYAEWGIAQGLTDGWGEAISRQTRENNWLNALEVTVVEPAAYKPLVAGQDPQAREVELLRVSANLAALRQAALDELGG